MQAGGNPAHGTIVTQDAKALAACLQPKKEVAALIHPGKKISRTWMIGPDIVGQPGKHRLHLFKVTN